MRDFLTHVSVVDVIQDSLHSFDYVVSLQRQHAIEVVGQVAGRRHFVGSTGAALAKLLRPLTLCRGAGAASDARQHPGKELAGL